MNLFTKLSSTFSGISGASKKTHQPTTSSRLANVLQVEDSLDDIALSYCIMKAENVEFNKHIVRNGEELIDFLSKRPPYTSAPQPDLILLDLNMPKLDGRSAIIYIHQHMPDLKAPIVVLSGSNDVNDQELATKYGADAFLSKPFSYEKLADLVEAIPHLKFFEQNAAHGEPSQPTRKKLLAV